MKPGMRMKARIARARRALAYADRFEADVKLLKLTLAQLEVLKADIAALRASADAVLKALLAEFKGAKH